MNNWQLAQNVGEFIDVNLPWLKMARPTWWASNIAKGRIANPLDYNEQDNGVFDFPALQQYANSWYAPWINSGLDLTIPYGTAKFIKWGTTPRLIGQGAESEVWSAPFSPYVTKIGGDIDYIELKNTLPRFLKQEYIGTTSGGIPKWRQLKSIPSKRISNKYRQNLAKENFYPAEFDGYDQTLAFNPERQLFVGDFDNNLGRLWWNPFRQYAYDLSALTPVEQLSIMKKGGKLIPRKFKSGGQIPKFKNAGILKKIWYWRSPDYSHLSFNEAFSMARNFKDEDFWWNGNIYNTKLKDQTSKSSLVKSSLNTNLSKEQYQLASDIWNYLQSKGVSPRNASAIMGNIMQESSFIRNAKQVGGDRAEGLFQMHGDDLKFYNHWKNNNQVGKYPELDYILYMIDSKDHPYTNEYKRVMNLPKTPDNQQYIQNVYGNRIKNNTLYLIDDFNTAWNDESKSLNNITDLFTDTIERAGRPEYEKRQQYAQDFYNHFYGQ